MRQGHELIINNNDAFMVSMLEKNNPFGLTLNDGKSMSTSLWKPICV